MSCFPGRSRVILENGRLKTMYELSVGDRVLTLNPDTNQTKVDEVLAFSHQLAPGKGDQTYIRLTLDNGAVLSATSRHLICTADKDEFSSCEYVFAENVSPGSYVYYIDAGGRAPVAMQRVSNVTVDISDQGLYSPLTSTGTLIVNGVLVSCYATLPSHSLMHFLWSPLRAFHSVSKYLGIMNIFHSLSDWLASSGESLDVHSRAIFSTAQYLTTG